MKIILTSATVLLATLVVLVPSARAQSADNILETIQLGRMTYKNDREAFIVQNMQFTESESAAFWPLYRSYRAEMEKMGDDMLKLVLEYADAYPNVPDERAARLLKDYTALEEKISSKRAAYLKKAAKIIPAAKVLRWAQLENRMDLGMRVQLAGTIPLVPAGQPAK